MSLLSRRHFVGASGALVLASRAAHAAVDAKGQLAALEARAGGRLYVSILNAATGARASHRGGERTLMCSTFKALLAAHILRRVERGEEKLDRRIVYTKEDLRPASPAATQRLAQGMTIGELCEATVTLSDNAAGNLLLAASGGPEGLTRFLRDLGDEVSRLDRIETELNYRAYEGDIRDTTTADAFLATLHKLIATEALSPSSRAQLAAWLIANKTGDARLRAGFPATWLVGDKTGTTEDRFGNANDIGVAWPPDRAPVFVAAFYEHPGMAGAERSKVIAEVGRIAATL